MSLTNTEDGREDGEVMNPGVDGDDGGEDGLGRGGIGVILISGTGS